VAGIACIKRNYSDLTVPACSNDALPKTNPIEQLERVVRDGRVVEQYQYDKCGNIVSMPGCNELRYGPGNQLLQAGSLRYEYDANGHIAARYENNGTTRYRYDFEGQLIEVRLPDGDICQYIYDAFGRRIAKSRNDAQTHFVWDDESLLEEIPTDHGPVEYLFIPETFFPLAHNIAGQTFLYNTNELGLPTEVFDEAGNLVRQPRYWAFGAIDDTEVPNIETPLRFAGQYRDAETGLYYNWFRYYAPDIGRYTSFDPLGMDAGIHGYQYTLNPVNWIDPFGLSKKIATLPHSMELARRRGVARMWAAERDRLRAGLKGSRNWTPSEQKIIKAGKAPPGWEGHHMKSVKHYYAKCKKIKNACKKKQAALQAQCRKEAKRLAESKTNLQPLKTGKGRAGRAGMKEPNEHLAAHRGNFCNATHGRFNVGW
jgi:RHS repeat-associated protein